MTFVPKPGKTNGPCRRLCLHESCERMRRIAEAPCTICLAPVGYGSGFIEIESGEPYAPVFYSHEICAAAEELRASKRLDEAKPPPTKEQHMENAPQQPKEKAHLAVVSSMPIVGGLVPRTMDEAMGMAKLLAESSLLPVHLRGKPADVLVTMLKGIELGLKPMVSFSEIYVVNGKPGCSAALKRALVESSPECEDARFIESTATKAVYQTKKRGRQPTSKTFTIEDAQKAGLMGKDVWKSHPAAMLRARASSAECDAEWSHVVQGLASLDELQEIEGRVVDVKPNRPDVMNSIAPPPPSPVTRVPSPTPPKAPNKVPDEPLDEDFEKLAKVEPEQPKPESSEPSAFEKLHVLLMEASDPKHLEALHAPIKNHPDEAEKKTLKQLYIRRSSEMVNARKAAAQ